MNDYLVGHIRTIVPMVVGAFIGWLVTLGILDPEAAIETQVALISGVTTICQAAYYALVRALAERFPWVGIFLGVNKAPDYAR